MTLYLYLVACFDTITSGMMFWVCSAHAHAVHSPSIVDHCSAFTSYAYYVTHNLTFAWGPRCTGYRLWLVRSDDGWWPGWPGMTTCHTVIWLSSIDWNRYQRSFLSYSGSPRHAMREKHEKWQALKFGRLQKKSLVDHFALEAQF